MMMRELFFALGSSTMVVWTIVGVAELIRAFNAFRIPSDAWKDAFSFGKEIRRMIMFRMFSYRLLIIVAKKEVK